MLSCIKNKKIPKTKAKSLIENQLRSNVAEQLSKHDDFFNRVLAIYFFFS